MVSRMRYNPNKGGWYDPDTGRLQSSTGIQIIGDIQPYKSMIDGSRVAGRAQHRAHLKAHGCIEVGNEKMERPKPVERIKSDQRKRALHQQFANMNDRQVRQAVRAEIESRRR